MLSTFVHLVEVASRCWGLFAATVLLRSVGCVIQPRGGEASVNIVMLIMSTSS
jgi:hypothetical protein